MKVGELPSPTKIAFVKTYKPGELTIDEFRKVADTRPADALILDVREKPVDSGSSARSRSLRASSRRVAEVPKDKEIVIHRIADTRPANALILDVREKPVDSMLLGALAIPYGELAARFAEVPKEKETVIHCNTGLLAKQAYDLLKAKGYDKVRWLDAVVVIGSGGVYEIAEK